MTNIRKLAFMLIVITVVLVFSGCTTNQTKTGGSVVPLKEAKLIIEHNATDEDTGFQGFLDSEGWEQLKVTGPDGKVLSFEGQGKLGDLGLTELFFETVEPENAKKPIKDLLSILPEGSYVFEGSTVDGKKTKGTAKLTHDIPAGPNLVAPAEAATVATKNLVMDWEPVTKTINGERAKIVAYQIIIETDKEAPKNVIGKPGLLSVHLPASATSLTVPNELLQPGTKYLWEVLAIEESGNQTISSSEFTTK